MSEHLEVITPSGEILFFPLDASRGVTAIGSGPSLDLRLSAPGIPEHAATLDHRQRPYQLTAVANGGVVRVNRRPLAPGESVALQPWDGVEIGGAVLILAEDVAGVAPAALPATLPAPAALPASGGMAASAAPAPQQSGAAAGRGASAPAGAPTLAPPAVVLPALVATGAIERIKHDYVPIRLDVPVRMVHAGQPATWELTVTNGSPNVARCTVTVVGDLYASWIAISDSEFPLLERESQKITITLLPPRHPSSRAGEHHFAVEVRLEDVDLFLAREPALLVIEPYYDYSVSAINPPDRNLRYGQRSADFVFTIENRGNSDVRYRVEGSDSEKATRVEFLEERPGSQPIAHVGEVEIIAAPQLDPLMNTPVVMRVRPHKRKFIASYARTYSLQAAVTPTVGTSPPNVRQVSIRHQPFTGRWIIYATLLLLAIILLLSLRPSVRTLTIDFANPNAEQQVDVSLLSDDSLFGRLGTRVRGLFGRPEAGLPAGLALVAPVSRSLAAPAPPAVGMPVPAARLLLQQNGPIQVRDGEQVTLRWEMRNGGQLQLRPITPLGEPLLQEDNTVVIRQGDFTFTPRPNLNDDGVSQGPTIYEVVVSNGLSRVPVISELGITRETFAIEVVPANAPIINLFEVSDPQPNLGSSVVIAWDAVMPNAGDELVLVTTSGETTEQTVLPEPVGTIVVVPAADTTYRLAASSAVWVGGTPQPSRNVDVAVVPPTATPVPPPVIRQFDIEPLTLLQGGSITVTYNISGADRRALILPGLDPARIDLETDIGRRFVQVPVAGQVDIILEALNLPAGFEDVADPLEAPARAFATAVASRIALVPTATPTSTPLPTPTATPREPVIEVLTISPVEVVIGDPTQVALTWNVIGDVDTITIEAPDFTFTTTSKRDTIAVPGDRGRTFVLTAIRGGEPRASKSVELKGLEPTPVPPTEPPPPPPPPTPTPTPTATPVGLPQIVSYVVTSDLPVRREVDTNNVDNFFVDGGAEVRIQWVIEGGTGASLVVRSGTETRTINDRLPTDEIVATASTDNVNYTLRAINNPNSAEITTTVPGASPLYGIAERPLIVRLNPPESYPPPTNVSFTGGITDTSPVRISWQYPADQASRILGFRVYKGFPGSTDPTRIANESTLNNTARTFEDAEPPTCGRVYYVVAVFENLLLPGADKTVETDAGDTSFLTPPCP